MSLSCSFCSHANPAGSKFCNECGSPLSFKPCPECEAVNPRGAETCHQCGADLTPQPTVSSDSFQERLDTLRRYVDTLQATPEGQRRLMSIAAAGESGAPPEPIRATPAIAAAAVEPLRIRAEPAFAMPHIADRAEPAGIAPVAATPAEPVARAVAASQASEPAWTGTAIGSGSASPVDATLAEPAAGKAPMTLTEPTFASPPDTAGTRRRLAPALFYGTGLALLVLGVLAYAYSLYGLPAQVEQWIGSVRTLAGMPEASTATVAVPDASPQSTGSATPAAAPEPVKTANTSAPMPASGADRVPNGPSTAPAGQTSGAATGAESNAVPAPPAATTAPESSGPAAQGSAPAGLAAAAAAPNETKAPLAAAAESNETKAPQATAAAEPTETKAPRAAAAPDAAPAKSSQARASPKKHASRASSKRADPRKAPANRSMTDPQELMPVGASNTRGVSDTRATAAPAVESCTRAVAALGLCNPNERQEAN